jgi:hypothetical protein
LIKALRRLIIKRTYLNIIKAICNKSIVDTILNRGKWKPFPLKSGIRVSILPTLIQYSTGIPSQSSKATERNKRD